MQRLVRLTFVALIGAAGLSAADLPATAASSIRIKVDDQPITSYDIAQRTALFHLTGVPGGEKAATEELINETLEFIEAAKRGVSVPDSRVDLAIADISQHVKMTPDKLKGALASQGVNIDTLRRRIKAQMTWGQLVQLKMQFDGASVKGSDVTAALFEESSGGNVKATEYMLQQIIFVVPKGSSSAYAEQRRREAEAFRIRFPGCDKSIDAAKQLKAVVVKDLGRRTSDELSGPDGQEIKDAGVGKTTRPVKSDAGFDLIAVCSARAIDSNAAARAQVESKLTLEQNKDLGKDYLAELRKKAVIEYR
jgi:peptidyl-prolyl cis-trans isomerase SurA